ncbi:MAG: hypothetical protein KDC54_16785 [Lewinella sp.]|nr:hypothetical protein [Lewinella sp.]
MSPILRNLLSVLAGIALGMVLNMGLLYLGSAIVPTPAGVDVMNTESIKANMHLFEPRHFLFPFLAHAGGTLGGAWLAARLSANQGMRWALVVGVIFLAFGVINVYSLPAPAWFNATDLILAYIPMGWLGGKLAKQ